MHASPKDRFHKEVSFYLPKENITRGVRCAKAATKGIENEIPVVTPHVVPHAAEYLKGFVYAGINRSTDHEYPEAKARDHVCSELRELRGRVMECGKDETLLITFYRSTSEHEVPLYFRDNTLLVHQTDQWKRLEDGYVLTTKEWEKTQTDCEGDVSQHRTSIMAERTQMVTIIDQLRETFAPQPTGDNDITSTRKELIERAETLIAQLDTNNQRNHDDAADALSYIQTNMTPEETIMSLHNEVSPANNVDIEHNQTLVNGSRAQCLSESQLWSLVEHQTKNVENLKAAKKVTKSKAINKRLTKAKAILKELIDMADAKAEENDASDNG